MLEEQAVLGQHESLLGVIQTLAGISHASPILDLGCGTGAWLKRLHDAGYRNLYGIDHDSEAFGAAGAAQFVAADLDSLDRVDQTSEGHFGLVTIIEVIEHVANPRHLVELAVRALAPDGWLLITSPNIYSLRARVKFLARSGMPYFEKHMLMLRPRTQTTFTLWCWKHTSERSSRRSTSRFVVFGPSLRVVALDRGGLPVLRRGHFGSHYPMIYPVTAFACCCANAQTIISTLSSHILYRWDNMAAFTAAKDT